MYQGSSSYQQAPATYSYASPDDPGGSQQQQQSHYNNEYNYDYSYDTGDFPGYATAASYQYTNDPAYYAEAAPLEH